MSTLDASPELSALVRGMTLVADGVLAIDLVPAPGSTAAWPSWEPGAHIDLVLPGAPVRQYSLWGDPADGVLRIAVLLEPESRGGSAYVHRTLRPGDIVTVRGPRNHFVLEPAAEYLFVAGGIGITPLLPMVRRARELGVPWSLVYLGSSAGRMPFLDELAGFGDGVVLVPGDRVERADLGALLAAHPGALVYACGPERMLGELQGLLADGDRLRLEYFAAPETEAGAPAAGSFTVRLERTGVDLEVTEDMTLIEAMRGAGVEVLSDCEEGICGSCETGVISGEVDHRDFVLTKQERERNDCLMVCVSRSACPLLVLDA
ncbi:PDR/VanB family oxidoreductase [Herbiconiux sp. 11R-BC]|uniref:PDR/VanB family oxidoreductase n=1 Tax=Herbiconiux sp. 11R-BC TaxID=3111637 RepID=UPI003C049443